MNPRLARSGPFLWHGAFLALTMAMIEPNTVLPALLSELTDSTAVFGFAYSILLGAPLAFNLLFSRWQQDAPKKKPFLLVGIITRALTFVSLAAVTFYSGALGPDGTLVLFLFFILLFSLSGGFAGIAYTDLIGRTIPSEERPALFAWRQVAGGVAGLAGAVVVGMLFARPDLGYPSNYAIALLIGAGGLLVGAGGFLFLAEPDSPQVAVPERHQPILHRVGAILKGDPQFRRFLVLENVTALSLMVLPFYMVFVRQSFAEASTLLGLYVFAQTAGALVSNLAWAALAKRWGARWVMRVCIALGASLPLVAWGLSFLGAPWFAPFFFLVGFVVSGRNIGFEPTLLELAPAEQRTLYLGIRGTFNALLVALPLIGGVLIQAWGFHPTFLLVSLGMAVALGLSFRRNS